jgi:hypothetical protein
LPPGWRVGASRRGPTTVICKPAEQLTRPFVLRR